MMKKTVNNSILQQNSKNLLVRPRLNTLLSKSVDYPVTSLIAGAGYGKTQTVLLFLSQLDANIVWIQLSDNDNYPMHFWDGFSQGLQSANSKLSAKIKKISFPDELSKFHQFLKVFSSELYQSKPIVIVFDDFHELTNPHILKFIENLILANLENLSIFILSRKEFPIKLTNVSDKDSLVQLDHTDLAFTYEEIDSYFKLQNIDITDKTLDQIYTQTQGWPFAIYLSGVYVRRGGDPGKNPIDTAMPIIFQMIESEIFSHYPPHIQYYIVKFSVLDNFSLGLMKELAGEYLYELNNLMEENMFINYNALTKQYHFHPLFSEFLEKKQHMLKESEIFQVYESTAKWFESNGQIFNALMYFRKYNNCEEIWRIIWSLNPGRFSEETTDILIEMIDSFPSDFVSNEPMTKVIRACLYNAYLDLDTAIMRLDEVIQELILLPDSSKIQTALGEAYIMQAFHYMISGSTDFKDLFKAASKCLPNGSTMFTKTFLLVNNDFSFTIKSGEKGEMTAMLKAIFEAVPYSEAVLNGSGYGREYLCIAEANYFTGNYKKATEYVYHSIYKAMDKDQADIVCSGYYLLCKISVAEGNYEDAVDFLAKLREYSDNYESKEYFSLPDIAEGWFYSKIEHVERVSDWINNEVLYDRIQVPISISRERLIKAYCLIDKKRYFQLATFVDDLEGIFKQRNLFFPLITLHILKALAYFYLNEEEKSIAAMQKAYDMTHQNQIIINYVEFSHHMCKYIEYLKRIKTHNIPVKWMDNIYSKSSTYSKRLTYIKAKYEETYKNTSDFVPSLSEREKEILQYLCQGLTREEIADEFDMTINTVKYTLKNIYTKLGAINGIDAARIATLKGIIK